MHRFILALLVVAALLCLAVIAFRIPPVLAHDWYSAKRDPVYGWSCCGGHDCARWAIRKGSISAEPTGLRVRLTLEETRAINPLAEYPIDALVVWPRIQPSEDGDWHLCVMSHARSPETGGVYCLFQPPST